MTAARWLHSGATSHSAFGAPTMDGENTMQIMHGLNKLREQDRMTWIEVAHGWVAAPDDVVDALSHDGFKECKRETTTSRRDLRPAGGVWQGVKAGTGSVASIVWVNQPRRAGALMFIAIDGEPLRDHAFRSAERDPYTDDGGES